MKFHEWWTFVYDKSLWCVKICVWLSIFCHFLVYSCISGLSDSNPFVCDSNPFSRRFENWKFALAIRIAPSVFRICFLEAKTSLNDSNHFFENLNPLYRELEILKFNISDSNHSFEDSNHLTISSIKPFNFFKITVLFRKQISCPFQMSHKPNQIVFLNWFFLRTHTHTHLISSFLHHFIPQKLKINHGTIITKTTQNEIDSYKIIERNG